MSRMSELDYDRQTIEAVRKGMGQGDTAVSSPINGHPGTEPEKTPEHKVGMAIEAVTNALDDLIALANREETRGLVCGEKKALGNALTRCETLCSFAMAVKPAPMMVRRAS